MILFILGLVLFVVSVWLTFKTNEPIVLFGVIILCLLSILPLMIGENFTEKLVTESDPIPLEEFTIDGQNTFIDIVGDKATVRTEGSFTNLYLSEIEVKPLKEKEEAPFIVKITTRKVTPDSWWYYKVHDHVFDILYEIHVNLQ